MGDNKAEGWSAIGDRGQTALSLTCDVDGTGWFLAETKCAFASLKVCSLTLACRGLTMLSVSPKLIWKLKDLYAEMCGPSHNGGWFQHLRNVHFISF